MEAMILLIDAGNTRIKLDWIRAGDARRAAQTIAFTVAQIDDARRWLAGLPEKPSRAVGVNVAGEPVRVLLEALAGCAVEWVGGSVQALGVRNGYRQPEQLGADRWAAMLGLAWHERMRSGGGKQASALLVTFGTATTIDTLCPASPGGSIDGGEPAFDFPGGMILPGPAMMLASLSAGTANLPQAQGETALYPQHTHQAIVTGMAAAQAGAVLRQWLAGLRHNGLPPEIYVSGGGWPMVRDETQRLLDEARTRLGMPVGPLHWLDAPVLDGLACLALAAPSAVHS